MRREALQYYMHDGPSAFRFELAGDLDNEGARELHQAWRTASTTIGGHELIVDMTFVTKVDEEGRSLLAGWFANGARIVAKSEVSRGLAETIIGRPLPDAAPPQGRWTWLPFGSTRESRREIKLPIRCNKVRD
jgi:ABC-type transporter Mla MlaB component